MIDKYGQAVMYLPLHLRSVAMSVCLNERTSVSEIVLRAGGRMSIYSGKKKLWLCEEKIITHEDIMTTLEIASGGSVHSVEESMSKGYITAYGGHRIGLGGTYIKGVGDKVKIRDVSSLSIRIAREVKDSAREVFPGVLKNGRFLNTIIVSPPGHGKTTMLRDLVRRLSDEGFRVSLVDERGEVAAKTGGIPQFDIGRNTDVSEGLTKSECAIRMLRSLSPEIIALDEVTDEADREAIRKITCCGVGILATLHGDREDVLHRESECENFCLQDVFEIAVVLKRRDDEFTSEIIELKEKGAV